MNGDPALGDWLSHFGDWLSHFRDRVPHFRARVPHFRDRVSHFRDWLRHFRDWLSPYRNRGRRIRDRNPHTRKSIDLRRDRLSPPRVCCGYWHDRADPARDRVDHRGKWWRRWGDRHGWSREWVGASRNRPRHIRDRVGSAELRSGTGAIGPRRTYPRMIGRATGGKPLARMWLRGSMDSGARNFAATGAGRCMRVAVFSRFPSSEHLSQLARISCQVSAGIRPPC